PRCADSVRSTGTRRSQARRTSSSSPRGRSRCSSASAGSLKAGSSCPSSRRRSVRSTVRTSRSSTLKVRTGSGWAGKRALPGLRGPHELNPVLAPPVPHGVVDVQDRRVLAVVVRANFVDAKGDRLHDGLTFERARYPFAATGPRHAAPVGLHHTALGRAGEHRYAEDRAALARGP